MNKELSKKDAFELCVICQQTRINCWQFQRLIYETLCFQLHLFLCSLFRNKPKPELTRRQTIRMIPILATLIELRRKSPPVPHYLHDGHLPAHWAEQDETEHYAQSPLEKVDYSLMWQLLLNRNPQQSRACSCFFLRSTLLIGHYSEGKTRRLFTSSKRESCDNPIANAVLQTLPKNEVGYTPPLCSITLTVPKHPGRVVPCGHTFSFKAIHRWAAEHPQEKAPCPNCRGPIEDIEQICLPIPIDHRRVHESTYLLWLSTLPKAKPIPNFQSQKSKITEWLLRHSLFFSNPGIQEIIQEQTIRP